jgi:hypothetical protein
MACMMEVRVTGPVEGLWLYLYILRQQHEKVCEGIVIIIFLKKAQNY